MFVLGVLLLAGFLAVVVLVPGLRAWAFSHLMLTGFIVILLVLVVLALGFLQMRDVFAIDRCLDGGGRWNYEERLCEGSQG